MSQHSYSLGRFSRAYEISPAFMPTGLSLPLCPNKGLIPLPTNIQRQQSLGKGPGGLAGKEELIGEVSSLHWVVGCRTMPMAWEKDRCHQQLTQEPCNLIGLLLLNGLIVEDFKEYVQHQDVLPAKGLGEET